MRRWLLAYAAGIFLALPLASQATDGSPEALTGNPEAGKSKAAVCAACHGPDGNSINPQWPKIAGQGAKYLTKQLHDFKLGETRANAIMTGQVAALSAQDMADLGAYFATRTLGGGVAAAEQIAAGERLYRGGNAANRVAACIGCHGPRGAGNAPGGIPALGGQYPEYVAAQLRAFRSGERRNDPNGMMAGVVRWMSDVEIDAVSQYVSGLH